MREHTLNKLRDLRLQGMYQGYRTAIETGEIYRLEAEPFLSGLVEIEWDEKINRKIIRAIQLAKFHYRASLEEVLYEESRNLDRSKIQHLAQCEFIKKSENILVTGATGTGKSYLASALGYHACSEGFRVKYFSLNKLIAQMKMTKHTGDYLKELKKLQYFDLLILDDFGLGTMDKDARLIILEVIEDKHQKGSIIVTSQLPVSKWFDVIGEQRIADAILDRLVHQAHRIELQGESMRKKLKNVK